MTKANKHSSKLLSLENELISVRHELSLLQSSRSHRTAKFIRQLASSSPAEIPQTLKQFPGLLNKYSIPEPEKKQDRVDLFNPLSSSLPLYRYPNINVALVSEGRSRLDTLFATTCNTMPLNSTHANELLSYNALQLLVIDLSAYQKERDLRQIESAVDSGARVIISGPGDFGTPTELSNLNPTTITLDTGIDSAIKPFADIYSVTQQTVPRTIGKDYRLIESTKDIGSISHDRISVLSKELLSNIDFESACTILEAIVSYCPIVAEGDLPDWIPDNVKVFVTEDELSALADDLSKPYAAERYSIACGRQATLESNSLMQVSPLLKDFGLVDKLPDNPKISVVLSMRRPQLLEHILGQLDKQTLRPHEVILMLHGASDSTKDQIDDTISQTNLNVKYEFLPQSILFGDVLNMAIDKAKGEFATKVDDDDYYGENHLLDLYAGYLKSRADFVGKWNHWVYIQADDETISWTPEETNRYVRHIPGGTLFGKTSTFREVKFGKVRRAIDSELYRRAIKRGAVLYSTHRYNYVRVRHDDHTYTATDADFKSRSDGNTIKGLPLEETLTT